MPRNSAPYGGAIVNMVSRKEGKIFFDAFRKNIAAFREFEQNLLGKNR